MNKKKIIKKLKKYWLEIIIVSIALITAIASIIFYFKSYQEEESRQSINISKPIESQNILKKEIWIDVSGSVNNPGLYKASSNTRLKEIIDKAGGLSDIADKGFFARNFNLARFLADQEKIYIPSVWEVQNGYFIENPQLISSPQINYQITNENQTSLININNATIDELDSLPGIGKTTAEKIINNRPYQNIEELLTKKIINQSVFEKIKDLISL